MDSPDTDADIQLRGILDDREISGFTMTAGAGSGKTTSLVKALAHVLRYRGDELRVNHQKVACVTYTEVAAEEIRGELANSPVVHVSTIHSFLWSLVKPFQHDIGRWVRKRAQDRLAETGPKQADKRRRLTEALDRLDQIDRFTYGVASDYGRGILGHEDVIKMVPELITSKPQLTTLLARSFPIVFVDESQDTFEEIVACLKHAAAQNPGRFCVGYFGDPMQKIYGRGVGPIQIPVDRRWATVEKPQNFRSPLRVLDVINAIREPADRLVQTSGLPVADQRPGEVTFIVLPADGTRPASLEQSRRWLAATSRIGAWRTTDGIDRTKILVIVHRMAAVRLGFANLYDTFHPTKLKDAFDEGRAWPLTPFRTIILPLCEAAAHDRTRLVPLLRSSSPLLRTDTLTAANAHERLDALAATVAQLADIFATGGPGSTGLALRAAIDGGLFEPDPRLTADDDPIMSGLREIDVHEVASYHTYIERDSPYSTHQGVKGAEFPHVLVVLDDDEGTHTQFSYDKLLGIGALSDTDREHLQAGEESVLERTRRLLYVCASRATEALAIVWYTHDVDAAVTALAASGIPGGKTSVTLDDIRATPTAA